MKKLIILFLAILFIGKISAQNENSKSYEGSVLDPISKSETESYVQISILKDLSFVSEEFNSDNELINTMNYTLSSPREDETLMGDPLTDYKVEEDDNIILTIIYHSDWVKEIMGFDNSLEISENGVLIHAYSLMEVNSTVDE